ncbi:MAG: DUF2764 family protein [Parachlamydiales bacterium]|nr:DUF2764 family protein [Parachlamydiales bacterium]
MTKYYFLATLLPSLNLGEEPELKFEELQKLLSANLTAEDFIKSRVLNRLCDLENFRAIWNQKPIDPHGNFSQRRLEELMVSHGTELPEYVADFLDRYSSTEDRLRFFPSLIASYFSQEIIGQKGFLRDYLEFERNLRIVLVALRTKSLNRDLSKELQFEDSRDDIVAEVLAQKETKSLDVPYGFEELRILYENTIQNPLEWHRALLEFRIRHITEIAGDDLFSIDRILAYQVLVALVEKWNALSKDAGIEIIDTLLKEIK